MAHLIWTEPSLTDLEEIAEYIALDNPGAARRLIVKIFDTVERLKQHPHSGRRPPELKKTIYREVIIGPCRVFYRVAGDNVYILHVMRSERNLRKYLLDEREAKMQE